MPFDPKHMIDIDDGRLVSRPEDLADAFADARQSGLPIVIHFHGGLISRGSAIDAATFATPFYEGANSYPIFPVWRTGLFETLGDTWVRIAGESLFRILVDRVSGWSHAQIDNAIGGARSASVERTLPPVTIDKMTESGETDGDFTPEFLQGVDVTVLEGEPIEPTPIEEAAITNALRKDTELKLEIDAALASAVPERSDDSRDLDGVAPQPPKPTLADPEVLRTLSADADTRSLSLAAAVKVAKIVARVLKRFHKGRDHGFHATVVEEVLRAFYLGSIGKTVWADMKSDAARSFADDDSAGNLMLAELAKVPEGQRVMLLGHSAGAIFISELFRKAGNDLRKVEVVLLAPAVRCKLFADGVVANADRLANFRMFSMHDDKEMRDTLVRDIPHVGDLTWFYPRSLLYLISGILEEDSGDDDVLGLERIHLDKWWNRTDESVRKARDFLKGAPGRVSWSITDGADPKMNTNSDRHGGFGSPRPDNVTMKSVGHILQHGW